MSYFFTFNCSILPEKELKTKVFKEYRTLIQQLAPLSGKGTEKYKKGNCLFHLSIMYKASQSYDHLLWNPSFDVNLTNEVGQSFLHLAVE